MYIDWSNFTPTHAALGGGLIGSGAALLFLGCGRIAGISGILARLHSHPDDQTAWRGIFLIGLILPAIILTLAGYGAHFAPNMAISSLYDWLRLLTAGFLVGIGTRLANGCTSGHGICGLARLSPRSLAAVATFMMCAMVVVALLGRADAP